MNLGSPVRAKERVIGDSVVTAFPQAKRMRPCAQQATDNPSAACFSHKASLGASAGTRKIFHERKMVLSVHLLMSCPVLH